jgi:subtilisin family serine protease
MDENGHGTHTAGTIGAVGNNSIGVVGVCWRVKIMGIKIYSALANDSTSAMVINAYNYVRMMKQRGVNIVATNNSYGGCPETCGNDKATKDAIDALGAAGVVNVFAAGNSGTDNDVSPFYPASYDSASIISVGGSDQNDNRIFNYGATSVDIAAPGSIIMSTTPMTNNPPYHNLSGTSMSTPHVTGAVALLASYNPSLSVASLKATIINSADMLPQFSGFNRAGGRLNVFNALQHQTVCTFQIDPGPVNVGTKGGIVSVPVSTGQNCDYDVKSSVNWIHVMSPDAMTGSGTVTFRVTFNPTITRTGTLTIAGTTVTIRQSRV